MLKTCPSGGSRHPTEVYVVAGDVEAIEQGLYHYSVRRHGLTRIRPGCHLARLREILFVKKDLPGFVPRAIFIYTSVVERSMFRYRESRSYRVVHHDVGHLIQNVSSIASSLGWRWYNGYSFHDDAVEEFLGVDGLTEPAMAYTAVR